MKYDKLERLSAEADEFGNVVLICNAAGNLYAADEVNAVITKFEEKLESVQASMYCDVVDADMENRKLKRALWLRRAHDASSFASLFSTLSDIEDDETRKYWIFGNKRKLVIDGLKCHRMEIAYKWFRIWDNVAHKCLKKVEEYK